MGTSYVAWTRLDRATFPMVSGGTANGLLWTASFLSEGVLLITQVVAPFDTKLVVVDVSSRSRLVDFVKILELGVARRGRRRR